MAKVPELQIPADPARALPSPHPRQRGRSGRAPRESAAACPRRTSAEHVLAPPERGGSRNVPRDPVPGQQPGAGPQGLKRGKRRTWAGH